jgi:2-keto-3-deoxygluconate permease
LWSTNQGEIVKILKTVTNLPGGLMVVPLFLGMLVNTFTPNLLKIGGFTQALTNIGYPTVLAMYLFTAGSKMTLRAAPKMLQRGFGILIAKVGVAILISLSISHLFHGNLIGLSTLAVLAAMNDTNGGMFLALTSTFGSKEDAGTYVVQSVETGPFLTMLVLVGAGLAVIPWLTMVSVIAPIAAGAVLGNLDSDIREFCGAHEAIIVPFMAFTLGQGINLKAVTAAGIPGIILGVTVLVVTGLVCYGADRLLGGSGIAAGNAVATPQAVALADHSFAGIAPVATLQVATSVIVTAILTPVLTAFVYRRNLKKGHAPVTGPAFGAVQKS